MGNDAAERAIEAATDELLPLLSLNGRLRELVIGIDRARLLLTVEHTAQVKETEAA